MDCSIASDESGTIEAQAESESLESDFLEGLIERSLEEGGIDSEERTESGLCHPCEHVGCVGFADSCIEGACWEAFERLRDSGAVGHGCGRGDCSFVALHDIGDRV